MMCSFVVFECTDVDVALGCRCATLLVPTVGGCGHRGPYEDEARMRIMKRTKMRMSAKPAKKTRSSTRTTRGSK